MKRTVSKEKVKAAAEELKALKVVEAKKDLVMREAVRTLDAQIREALKRGHSYESVAHLLKRHDIDLKPATLKAYMTEKKAKRRTAKKNGDPKATQLAAAETTTAATTPDTTPKVPPKSAKGGGTFEFQPDRTDL